MKVSKNFHDYELVPPRIYELYGNNSKWFINPRVVHLAQFVRDWFDSSVTVNDWKWGGKLKNRGYRVPSTTVGSKYSQHKLANAIDINVQGVTPDEVRSEIHAHYGVFMKNGLTTLEHPDYSPTWVHMDVRHTGLNYILIVKPARTRLIGTMSADETFRYKKGKYVPVSVY